MIPYTRKVLDTATPDNDDGVFLEGVTFSGDIGGYFHAV